MDGGGLPEGTGGLIGPSALLHLMAVLDRHERGAMRDALFARSVVLPPPHDAGMWPEADCAAVHRGLRQNLPARAEGLLRLAGEATADYILANRIPAAVRALLRALPAMASARLLSAAIDRHSRTFAGSGRFALTGRFPLTFEIAGNPLIAGEVAVVPLCAWHAAVFERLFRRLVTTRAVVTETACAAMGAPACRFEVRLRRGPAALLPHG
jgi:divinyl protochlorophyllide a 8-vinyl-reductase